MYHLWCIYTPSVVHQSLCTEENLRSLADIAISTWIGKIAHYHLILHAPITGAEDPGDDGRGGPPHPRSRWTHSGRPGGGVWP